MRRGLVWPVTALGTVVMLVAMATATARATPDAQPSLATGPSWRVLDDTRGPVPRGPIADTAWLARGSVPGKGTRWEDVGRTALLDLHQLSLPSGAVAAGPGSIWNYVWPRDTAFVAVALARTGHHSEALQALTFLQRVQLQDGGFEARYLLDGSGPPDDRAPQSDGAGWALWAAWQVTKASGDFDDLADLGDLSGPATLRPLLDKATGFALAATDDGQRLPRPSPDYWEVRVSRTSLGTVAPLLAGLEASQQMYAALGEPALASRSGAAAARLRGTIRERFADGYERFASDRFGPGLFRGNGGRDAAVTFLMEPFTRSPSPAVMDAWRRYQSEALRPAGGLAPGSQWKNDGISWTPETALVAYTAAMNGQPEVSAQWLDWLDSHRTPWGSVPEKVLANGAPAGPAPLAWTAALVVLTTTELETRERSSSQAILPVLVVR